MKFVSIDVGTKNLSFCFFDVSGTNISILDWENINIAEAVVSTCETIDCKTKPTYVFDGKCFCTKHAKKMPYIIPSRENKLQESTVKKATLPALKSLCSTHFIPFDTSSKKKDLVEKLLAFINAKCFKTVTKTDATKVDLATIARNLADKFDAIFNDHFSSIDLVIIENQIGPLASKMKTIQGMLTQYFVMRQQNIKVEFISASNKLKTLTKETKNVSDETQTDRQAYTKRKNLGKTTCENILRTTPEFSKWLTFMSNHSKKDDLADCFLQGMWYINNKINK